MKKSKISLLIFVLIISLFGVVNAASGSINLGASSETVKKGETFTVTLIGTADNNITALQANLEYNTNKLSIDNKKVGAGFADLSGENEIAIAATSSDSLSKTATLYTITFKVADDATAGETEIKFKNISLAVVNENKEQETAKVADESITIEIVKNATENKVENSTNNDDNLPQTGIEDINFVLIASLVVISIISYLMYRKYNNI